MYIYIYIYIYIFKYIYTGERKVRKVNTNVLRYRLVSSRGFFRLNVSKLKFVRNQIYINKICRLLFFEPYVLKLLECSC